MKLPNKRQSGRREVRNCRFRVHAPSRHPGGNGFVVRYRLPVSSFRRSGCRSRSRNRFTTAGKGADSPRSYRENALWLPPVNSAALAWLRPSFLRIRRMTSWFCRRALRSGRGVPLCASLVEFNLPARGTTPSRQALQEPLREWGRLRARLRHHIRADRLKGDGIRPNAVHLHNARRKEEKRCQRLAPGTPLLDRLADRTSTGKVVSNPSPAVTKHWATYHSDANRRADPSQPYFWISGYSKHLPLTLVIPGTPLSGHFRAVAND